MSTIETIDPQSAERSPEERVLIVAPTACDADILRQILCEAGIEADICGGVEQLCREAGRGAAAALLAEEVLSPDTPGLLSELVADHGEWSDFPLIVMAAGRSSTSWGRRRSP